MSHNIMNLGRNLGMGAMRAPRPSFLHFRQGANFSHFFFFCRQTEQRLLRTRGPHRPLRFYDSYSSISPLYCINIDLEFLGCFIEQHLLLTFPDYTISTTPPPPPKQPSCVLVPTQSPMGMPMEPPMELVRLRHMPFAYTS